MPTKASATAVSLCAAAWAASFLLLGRLSPSLAIHWDIYGRPDGFGAKEWAAFFYPALLSFLTATACSLPRLCPGRYAPEELGTTYPGLWLTVLGLVTYLHGISLAWGCGALADTDRALSVGLFAFIGAAGLVLGKVKAGYRLGFRAPWTVNDAETWTETHRFAGRAMPAGAALGLAASVAGAPFPPLFALALLCLCAPAAYSFLRHR